MHDLKQALFAAHFTYARDISDKELLADIAEEIRLDRSEAVRYWKINALLKQFIKHSSRGASQQAIQSVPSGIFNQKYLVSGAQGVENFKHFLQQLTETSE